MTEPDNSDVSASAEVTPTGAAEADFPQFVAPQVPADAPVESEVVLATYEPHTLQVSSERAITPAGTKVSANEAAELIELGAKNGVHVYQMGS